MARNFTRTQRQTKRWIGLGLSNVAFTGSLTSRQGVFNFEEGRTVLRMIGEYLIMSTAAPVALDAAGIAIGIGVVSTDASTVGGTAMPDPQDEPEYPWLFWASHTWRSNSANIDSALGSTVIRRSFDIKSMRKVKPRESLAVLIQYTDRGGAPPVSVIMENTRVLIGGP